VIAGRIALTKSEQMARVRSRNTFPELALRHALWHLGFRYRIHSALPGSPDIVFPRYRTAVFVDGCFWHGCPDHYRAPVTNEATWSAKLIRNMDRDARADAELARMDWQVIRVWEHEISSDVGAVGLRVADRLRSSDKAH
jgi:DNA mismatch endonuclease (patch repair protein)